MSLPPPNWKKEGGRGREGTEIGKENERGGLKSGMGAYLREAVYGQITREITGD